MKRILCLIMFIGMISFTGFATTSDLTKNSDIAFSVDNDVGVEVAILVEKNLTINYDLFIEPYMARGVTIYKATMSTSDTYNILNNNIEKRKEDKLSTVIDQAIKLSNQPFKLARDGFIC